MEQPLHIIVSIIGAERYVNLLQENILPFHPNGFILMHDNAPPHRANLTKSYFETKKNDCLKWAPYLPDCSPIKNIWGILCRKNYVNGQFYQSFLSDWNKITINEVRRHHILI